MAKQRMPDSRYNVAREFCGQEEAKWVARFAGRWLGWRDSEAEAIALCSEIHDKRSGEPNGLRASDESARWFEGMVSRVADSAFRRLMATGGIGALHLYHRRGGLAVFGEDEETTGWEISDSARLPTDRSRDQLRAWIWHRARRLPCLPE